MPTRINEWKQIEFQKEAERLREEALKARDLPSAQYKQL
jgi:hypothetical protein